MRDCWSKHQLDLPCQPPDAASQKILCLFSESSGPLTPTSNKNKITRANAQGAEVPHYSCSEIYTVNIVGSRGPRKTNKCRCGTRSRNLAWLSMPVQNVVLNKMVSTCCCCRSPPPFSAQLSNLALLFERAATRRSGRQIVQLVAQSLTFDQFDHHIHQTFLK
jgi:hypothetical protein